MSPPRDRSWSTRFAHVAAARPSWSARLAHVAAARPSLRARLAHVVTTRAARRLRKESRRRCTSLPGFPDRPCPHCMAEPQAPEGPRRRHTTIPGSPERPMSPPHGRAESSRRPMSPPHGRAESSRRPMSPPHGRAKNSSNGHVEAARPSRKLQERSRSGCTAALGFPKRSCSRRTEVMDQRPRRIGEMVQETGRLRGICLPGPAASQADALLTACLLAPVARSGLFAYVVDQCCPRSAPCHCDSGAWQSYSHRKHDGLRADKSCTYVACLGD